MSFHRVNNCVIVLVSEDSETLKLYSEYLSLNGFKIIPFKDPLKALIYLHSDFFNCKIVVADHKLTKMTGLDLIKKISKRNNRDGRVKFILISNYLKENFNDKKDIDNYSENKSNKIRIDKILKKPLKVERLKSAIEEVLNEEQKIII